MERLDAIRSKMTTFLNDHKLFKEEKGKILITRQDTKMLISALRGQIIPSFFKTNWTLEETYELCLRLFKSAFDYKKEDVDVEEVTISFLEQLPKIAKMLAKDVEAFYEGDPAAKSKEEIIISYPGFYAIFVYRIAHEMYLLNIPYLPRIISEMAHSSTGIDINPGANIQEGFFIDHGTGVVIGETCVIGKGVKVYQGVTLGALSVKGQKMANVKRHPTIEDDVTIYAQATVLGGDVVIGKNSIIGGSAFVTTSIPENSIVKIELAPLQVKEKFNK